MKYKTLFRVGLKLLGVYFAITGANTLITYLFQVGAAFVTGNARFGAPAWYMWVYMAGSLFELGIGLYLFFDGRWVADKAIPGNRPYCQECGYDLSHAVGNVCNECGTPFRREDVQPRAAVPE